MPNVWCNASQNYQSSDFVEDDGVIHCLQRIVHISEHLKAMEFHPLIDRMSEAMMQRIIGCNYACFRGVAISFFYRLRNVSLNMIYRNVQRSIVESMKLSDFNPINTVSLPIRATDKCRREGYGGEMDCWSENEYVAFLASLRYLSSDRINTVIITSESRQMSVGVAEQLKKENNEWNVILNVNDRQPETGNSHRIKSENVHTLPDDVIIGALSSLMLQTNGKYVAF